VFAFLVFCWYCFHIGSVVLRVVFVADIYIYIYIYNYNIIYMWILGAIVVVDIGAVCLVLGVVVVALGVGCCCLHWEQFNIADISCNANLSYSTFFNFSNLNVILALLPTCSTYLTFCSHYI